jgi:hypothetical protein
MELPIKDQKVMGKVVRYFRSLEEMAAYMGLDVDLLIDKIQSQQLHLTLEKKSTFNSRRSQVFKNAEAKYASLLCNYLVG